MAVPGWNMNINILKMWFWAVAILSSIVAALSQQPPCPKEDKIYPCFCEDDDPDLTSVQCSEINEIEDILPVLKNTLGTGVSFGFWSSNLGNIPSNFFKGHTSKNLHFENCQITSFGEKPFTGLEDSLVKLFVYGSINKRENDFKTFPLGHLKNLEEVMIIANEIKKLSNDWFRGDLNSLTQLNLEANDIEELGDKVFADLINVEQIWMGDNRFNKVYRSMFPNPAKKLHMLEMSFSGIEELPQDIFENMPNLKYINISGNKLKTLLESVFGKVWSQINDIYFQRNTGFVCDEKLKWIFQKKLPEQFHGGECGGNNKLTGRIVEELELEDF